MEMIGGSGLHPQYNAAILLRPRPGCAILKAVLGDTISIEFPAAAAERDGLIADLGEAGCTGILETDLPEDGVWLRVFFEEPAPPMAQDLLARRGARLVRHEAQDWVAASRALWEPFAVGERFYLVPEWRNDSAPPGRWVIRFNPGLACGTGAHEATQLCLEALERYVKPGTRLLDVGCGSGILCIAASLLGASRVWGCDLDPQAVEIARANLAQAGVAGEIVLGSTTAAPTASFDLALCNISPEADIALAPELARALAPGGIAVLSGFETPELGQVLSAVAALGYPILEERQKGNWCAIAYAQASGGAG